MNFSHRKFQPVRFLHIAAAAAAASCLLACRAFAADANSKEAPIMPSQGSGNATPAPAPELPPGVSVSAGDSPITDPDVVARIGNTEIKVEEMRALLASLSPEQQAAIAADPVALNKAVRAILMEKVVLNEVTAKQWDQQAAVKARLDRIREAALADMYLTELSKPADDYPSDAEVHAAYDAHKTAFSVPHQFLIAQIFVAVSINADKDANDKAQAKLDAIQKELQEPGADFAKIAQVDSEDKLSAQDGGKMGWLKDPQMVPRIRAQAHLLAKGAISVPVRLTDGWHILKLLDTKDISVASFDSVKDRLVQKLRSEREFANRLACMNRLLGDYPVTINDRAVATIPQKTAATTPSAPAAPADAQKPAATAPATPTPAGH